MAVLTKKAARKADSSIYGILQFVCATAFGFWMRSVAAGIFMLAPLIGILNVGWSIEYGRMPYEEMKSRVTLAENQTHEAERRDLRGSLDLWHDSGDWCLSGGCIEVSVIQEAHKKIGPLLRCSTRTVYSPIVVRS